VVLNEPLNIRAIFGLFMLFGIVKKNGILQVDYTNTLRAASNARKPSCRPTAPACDRFS
jgi:multidrug efflux pump subunit AcrB